MSGTTVVVRTFRASNTLLYYPVHLLRGAVGFEPLFNERFHSRLPVCYRETHQIRALAMGGQLQPTMRTETEAEAAHTALVYEILS